MLTPNDIHNKEFKKSFRGYCESDVDEFVHQIVQDYEKLYRENVELKETLDRVNSKLQHFQHMETTLHSTLVIAQETAEEVKINARKETELMVKEAEVRSQRMLDEAMSKVRKAHNDYEELLKQGQVFRSRFRTLLQAQLELMQQSEQDV